MRCLFVFLILRVTSVVTDSMTNWHIFNCFVSIIVSRQIATVNCQSRVARTRAFNDMSGVMPTNLLRDTDADLNARHHSLKHIFIRNRYMFIAADNMHIKYCAIYDSWALYPALNKASIKLVKLRVRALVKLRASFQNKFLTSKEL